MEQGIHASGLEVHLFQSFVQQASLAQQFNKLPNFDYFRSLCHDREGWGPYSDSRDTDLTRCFETGIALPLPCALIAIFGLLSISLLYKQQKIERGNWSDRLLQWKLLLLSLTVVASLGHLVLAVLVNVDPLHNQYTYFAVLLTIAAFVSVPLTQLTHTRTRRGSDLLLAFWTVFLVTSVPYIRTTILLNGLRDGKRLALFLSFLAFIAFTIPAFYLESLGPEWRGPSKYGQIRLEDHGYPQNENPALTANFFSRITFSYMTPLMKLGAKRYLEEDDIYALAPEDQSEALCRTLEKNWKKARASANAKSTPEKKKKASLYLALARSYGRVYATAGVFKLFNDLLAFAQPQLLRLLLKFVASYRTETPDPPIRGVVIAVVMLLAAVVQTALVHQYFDRAFATGMRVKASIITLIYKKSLVISNGEKSGRATGDIVNLQSVDAAKLGDLCQYGQMLWSAPVQVTAAFTSLWFLLGWPALCGVTVMILALPFNTMLAKYQKTLQVRQMKIKDRRTRLMNEILSNMRSIKLYAWEPTFTQKILQVRNDEELRMTRKIGIVSSAVTTFMTTIPIVVAFTTFTAYAYTSPVPLTSDVIFPAISLFSLLQFPLAVFPNVLSSLIESIVSEARLVNFLDAEELQTDARTVILRGPDDAEPKRGDELVTIKDGEFRWNPKAVEPTLRDINLSVRKGELLAVMGRVGDGKTSLLAAILGELTRTKGEVVVRGSVAYFSQQTFVLSATVKDNILFGHVFEEEFYNRVLDACALRPDLVILPHGDQTEIGEKGVSLSGGQRARIALARAVYARADIYILDDPLSAVDNHVAAHLFKHVIGPKGLLRSKARILCTNSVAFLAQTDNLLMLRAGRMVEQTTYIEAMALRSGPLFTLITGLGKQAETASAEEIDDAATVVDNSPSTPSSAVSDTEETDETIEKKKRRMSVSSFREAELLTASQAREYAIKDLKESARPKEVSERGQVKTQVYSKYIRAVNPIGVIVYLFAIVAAQGMAIGGNLVLSSWTSENQRVGHTSRVGYHLFLYGMAGLAASFANLLSSLVLWVYCAIRGSRIMHDSAFAALMRSPMSFFEMTPQGRVMNLFSRDVYVVDEVLIRVFSGFFRTLSTVAGVLFVISIGAPIVLVCVIPIFFAYRSMMKYYLATSRELKRYDSTSRAPVFSWFGESLTGLTTIRAYNQQDRFILNNEARLDRNQTCYFPSVTVNRWLAVRLELVGSLLMFLAALASVWALSTSKTVDAGLVGLMMSYAVSVTGALNWVVRSASEVETNIVSVERVLNYTTLKSEAPAEIEETKPPSTWPAHGRVEFRDYATRYRPELDLCIKNISLDIKPGEKIGVCGRTGAGKSSLTLSLFRIIEAAEGSILIDGVDISKIGLHDLRSAVSIIPQDPQLFEGTIRDNVDPVSEHSDADIWNALTQSHLRPHVESMDGKLSAAVSEGGQNLSAGQKQLICFARALLRKSKILVLDEATSAIDLETDAAVQEILRGKDFLGITTITIAHRLDTIINSDRVVVMNEGSVAEFDTPAALLSKTDTIFSALCAAAGLGIDSIAKQPSPSEETELHNTFI